MPQASDPGRRLSTLDAGFLYFERPTQVLHVASTLTFQDTLDYERVITDLRIRLPLVPRYMDRVIPAPLGLAHPTWEHDPNFDLRAHVHRRTLRPPGTDQQLAELCATLYMQPLDRAKPLWELYVIDGYRGDGRPSDTPATQRVASAERTETSRPPRSALFVKVHHCMIDGISGVQLLAILLDTTPKPQSISPPGVQQRPALPTATVRLLDALSDRLTVGVRRGIATLGLMASPGHALQELRDTADALAHLLLKSLMRPPPTPFNGQLGIARGLAWASFSLNETKTIKNRLGGSVNDVVLAVISGAMRRVLTERGMNADRIELRAAVPVNIRGTHEHLKLGNQISMMIAPLPIGILDPVERLRQVRAATALLKTGDESGKTERVLELVDLVPPAVQQFLGWFKGLAGPVNTICTNVPGPPISLYMQGVRLERMVPFVPLADPVGLAFAILSYADTLTIGVTADAALVPDLREIVGPLYAAFEELWVATGLSRTTRIGPIPPERQRRNNRAARTDGGPVAQATAMGSRESPRQH